MKKKNVKTEIAYILDRSGSMSHLTESAVAGFNAFLFEQQETNPKARLSLILFDDEYETVFENCPILEVPRLDTRTYFARGTTALLDAIGITIDQMKSRQKKAKKEKRPDLTILAIYTDGYENASQLYSWEKVAKKIKKRQLADEWEFLFLGADRDAIATASRINIPAAHAAYAPATREGVRASAQGVSKGCLNFFEARVTGIQKAAALQAVVDEEL